MPLIKILSTALLLALVSAATASAQMAEKLLAESKAWKASLFRQAGTNAEMCMGFTQIELTGRMFGVQFIDGMGFFVTTRIPWTEKLPQEAPFIVEVGANTYPFRGKAFSEHKASGTMFLMPVSDLQLFSRLLQDIADGNHATVRSLTVNQKYSLAGSQAAMEAFYTCSKRLMSAS